MTRLASAARPYGLTADFGDSLSQFYGRQKCIDHTQKLHPQTYVGAVFDRPPRYNAQLYGIYRRARLASAARPYGLTADFGDSLSQFYGRQKCIDHTQKLHPQTYVGAVFDRPPRYNAQLYGIYRRARLASAARPYGLTADFGDSLSQFYGRQKCIDHTQKLHPQTIVGAVFDRPRYNTQIYVICRRCVVCYDIPVDDQAGHRSSPLPLSSKYYAFPASSSSTSPAAAAWLSIPWAAFKAASSASSSASRLLFLPRRRTSIS